MYVMKKLSDASVTLEKKTNAVKYRSKAFWVDAYDPLVFHFRFLPHTHPLVLTVLPGQNPEVLVMSS